MSTYLFANVVHYLVVFCTRQLTLSISISACAKAMPTLFGVNLASETFATDAGKDLRLGVIRAHRSCLLVSVRDLMTGHVRDLPDAFGFVTADGCALLIYMI